MRDIIQKIIFPKTEEQKAHYNLYYRGGCGIEFSSDEKEGIGFPKFSRIEFNTYFNGFSNAKWKKYTDISNVTLTLKISGEFILKILGFNLKLNSPGLQLYSKKRYSCLTSEEITIAFPDTKDTMLAFEIETISECSIYSGYYSAEFDSDNHTTIAISTTTCFKEEYIKHNIKLLYDELLMADKEISRHLYIHIVDNGRTLSSNDFPSDPRIFLHSNKNVGGSGGFARGMIECVHQKEKITNILLMDDDVVVLPESIQKTYYLLKHLKKEYQNNFIAGAMLNMESVQVQHEDIGEIKCDGYVNFRELNQECLWDNLYNERDYPIDDKHRYSAWWYCCIPINTVRKYGLPLPLFIKADDMEYSLRCKPGFITMNGICVWHMSFNGKVDAAMGYYQGNRNLLITQAVSDVMKDVNIIDKDAWDFRVALRCMDYDSAELCLRAIEHYLKGPSIILEDRGEKILKENKKQVHKMQPLKDIKFADPEAEENRNITQWIIYKIVFKLTANGHRFWIGRYNKKPATVLYNRPWIPSKVYLRKTVIVVNPEDKTGYILKRDNARFKRLMRKYKAAMKTYKKKKDKLREEYRKYRNEMYSEKFWRKYLEI